MRSRALVDLVMRCLLCNRGLCGVHRTRIGAVARGLVLSCNGGITGWRSGYKVSMVCFEQENIIEIVSLRCVGSVRRFNLDLHVQSSSIYGRLRWIASNDFVKYALPYLFFWAYLGMACGVCSFILAAIYLFCMIRRREHKTKEGSRQAKSHSRERCPHQWWSQNTRRELLSRSPRSLKHSVQGLGVFGCMRYSVQ